MYLKQFQASQKTELNSINKSFSFSNLNLKRTRTSAFEVVRLNYMNQHGYTFKYPLPSLQALLSAVARKPSLAVADNRSTRGPEGYRRAQGSMFTAAYARN